jgi:hypothetical protein
MLIGTRVGTRACHLSEIGPARLSSGAYLSIGWRAVLRMLVVDEASYMVLPFLQPVGLDKRDRTSTPSRKYISTPE